MNSGWRSSVAEVDVTCTFTNTRKTTTLTVTKHLEPTSDDGLFIMQAGGKSGAQAGHGALVTATVQVSETVHFTETAGSETDLANYTTTFACDNGGPSGSSASGSLSMPAADVTCTFTNIRRSETLTVTKSGAGAGIVTSNPDGIDCGPTCMASFPAGTSIALTAVPDANSVFGGWGGGCDANGNVTIIAGTTCNAAFLEDTGIELPYYLPLILR